MSSAGTPWLHLELRRLRDPAGIIRVDGTKKGVFTRDRKPKTAAFDVRKRWTATGADAS